MTTAILFYLALALAFATGFTLGCVFGSSGNDDKRSVSATGEINVNQYQSAAFQQCRHEGELQAKGFQAAMMNMNAEAPPESGKLEQIEKLICSQAANAAELAARAHVLADRLLGPEPEQAGLASGLAPQPVPQLAKLYDVSDLLSRHLSDLRYQIARLERL